MVVVQYADWQRQIIRLKREEFSQSHQTRHWRNDGVKKQYEKKTKIGAT